MKLQILSDLHIDSYDKRDIPNGNIPITHSDIILVAGDTANSDYGMQWLQQQAAINNKPIVTIAGNHEYFGEDILTFDKKLQLWDNFNSQTQQGLKFLQCATFDIADVRILGCTLWTDYEFEATSDTVEAAIRFMRDYRQIIAGRELFSPELSVKIHQQHRQWLKNALIQSQLDGKKTVVMTHHSISKKSVSKRYQGLPSNAAFVTELSEWMYEDWAPKLWVHGHTHEAFDYAINNTRIVVNPRAYPGEISSTDLLFDWTKVVEV